MANWISSKLKVAETFFEQIDQQAAESLKKGENPRSDLPDVVAPKSGGSVPLKDQLKKKSPEKNANFGKLGSGSSFADGNSNLGRVKEVSSSSKLSVKPESSLTDSDWTELLSTTNPPSSSKIGTKVSAIRGLRRDSKKQGNSVGSGLSFNVSEVKRNQRSGSSSVASSPRDRRLGVAGELQLNGKGSDGSDSVGRTSSVELPSDGKFVEGGDVEKKDRDENLVVEVIDETRKENGGKVDSKSLPLQDLARKLSMNSLLGVDSVSGGDAVRKGDSNVASQSSSDAKRESSYSSDGVSDSDLDSGLSSDSESEGEREERKRRREKILAEKAAAKAAEAIKERENRLARLEGEKQSLEKYLKNELNNKHKRKDCEALASELQTAMMQMMEAVDLEKQKHNNTRMEALARLAKLETANAHLARSLANAQWNLEVEANRVADLKQQTEMKEVSTEELRSRISNAHQSKSSRNQLSASKGAELEREILESEYALITDKIERLQDKAKELEASIEMARKEIEDPTEVEAELKRRLGQLTDHLIQKQSQVEALSSEKASLLFRIEAVSRMLDENKNNVTDTSFRDLESGTWVISRSKLKPLFHEKLHSGSKHLGSLLVQLDAIFSAGSAFIRRNSTAKIWSLIYLVCLHFWVIYILKSHSQPSSEARSGAVISLENMNNTDTV